MPLILEDQTYQLRGALFLVYRELKGSGISEEAWENALAVVLGEKGIPCKTQVPYPIFYKGAQIGFLKPDVVAWDQILLELKVAPEGLAPILPRRHFRTSRSLGLSWACWSTLARQTLRSSACRISSAIESIRNLWRVMLIRVAN